MQLGSAAPYYVFKYLFLGGLVGDIEVRVARRTGAIQILTFRALLAYYDTPFS